jgi:hypothetical protein
MTLPSVVTRPLRQLQRAGQSTAQAWGHLGNNLNATAKLLTAENLVLPFDNTFCNKVDNAMKLAGRLEKLIKLVPDDMEARIAGLHRAKNPAMLTGGLMTASLLLTPMFHALGLILLPLAGVSALATHIAYRRGKSSTLPTPGAPVSPNGLLLLRQRFNLPQLRALS